MNLSPQEEQTILTRLRKDLDLFQSVLSLPGLTSSQRVGIAEKISEIKGRIRLWEKGMDCRGCGQIVEDYYMVSDAVWLKAFGTDEGHAHIDCLEKALGRMLVYEDFSSAPVNVQFRRGYQIGKRTIR